MTDNFECCTGWEFIEFSAGNDCSIMNKKIKIRTFTGVCSSDGTTACTELHPMFQRPANFLQYTGRE